MRRGMWIGVLLVVILVGIAVGVGAYNLGLSEGLEQTGRAGEVVRVIGPHGFFPFGLILFPLFFFGLFFLMRAAFWGHRWGAPGHWGPGPRGGPAAIEDWHRRLHEEQRSTTGESGRA